MERFHSGRRYIGKSGESEECRRLAEGI